MKYYLTTPIYYVNAAPHIGHAYTTIVADVIKRHKQMQGYEVVLTTGTDEHGQKVERAARAAGKTPQEFTDLISAEFRRQWEVLGLAVDRFQRTSNPQHHRAVQQLFTLCRDNGYIHKGAYTGQYCFFDELYASEAGPGDPCPECGRPTETVTEENLFFRLSAFRDRLLRLYEEQPDFIRPASRRNEVIAFVQRGLSDLSISRTTIQWGIPVPDEPAHVFYVWFDALTTYMSAVEGEDLWPADLHLIGKEILRFHAVYWPAFLMAAGLPLPRQIFAHGWLLFEQEKMSKSRGNIVRATPIAQVAGTDALRYFLLREVVFGQDGSFSYDALVNRYNADLANGLGNLASRTLTMIRQYTGGAVPAPSGSSEAIAGLARQVIASATAAFDNFDFSRGLETVWSLLSATDKYLVERAPWSLAREDDAGARALLADTLYTAAEVLRIAAALLAPVLPVSAAKLWSQLGMAHPLHGVRLHDLAWGQLPPGQRVGAVEPIFPRLDAAAAVRQMRALEERELERQAALLAPRPSPAPTASGERRISLDDFAKVDLRVGQVLAAEPVQGTDKLLHLTVDVGEGKPRSIVAGIAGAYGPAELVGRKVVVVANLEPRKLRGITSEGMVVAATAEDGRPVLAGFLEEVPVGSRLK
ncbi:MAG: methionine--tRNA ligase [Bryobacterales bacterium]|nr:methionine--tRNA ligase [Bryobacteraceae bacterium]MDW8353346.1 methionine--tRNA ligase [Bryobacterales bacterium]